MCISRFREGCVLQQQSLLYFSLGKMATGYVCVLLCSLLAVAVTVCLFLCVSVLCGPNVTSVERVTVELQLCVEVISRISARTHSFISLSVDVDETLP